MGLLIETPRLLLREMTAADFASLCRILCDDEVMYAYEGAFSEESARHWLNRQSAFYRDYGFGIWAVILKSTGEMIGQCGLNPKLWGPRQVFEITYLFEKKHWGQGYAAEAASRCRDYAFEKLRCREIFCFIRENNSPSIQVANKMGLKLCGNMVLHYRGKELPHLVYSTNRDDVSGGEERSAPRLEDHLQVISGGPGSGKTSLITALAERGYKISPEAGRGIIKTQMAIGGSALPWGDRKAFSELMLAWELRSHQEALSGPGPVFFDRGLPDIIGYLRLNELKIEDHILKAANLFRYNGQVFIAPPWQEIYRQDEERKQPWAEAVATCESMVKAYMALGYDVVYLPCASVEERVEFVLGYLKTTFWKGGLPNDA